MQKSIIDVVLPETPSTRDYNSQNQPNRSKLDHQTESLIKIYTFNLIETLSTKQSFLLAKLPSPCRLTLNTQQQDTRFAPGGGWTNNQVPLLDKAMTSSFMASIQLRDNKAFKTGDSCLIDVQLGAESHSMLPFRCQQRDRSIIRRCRVTIAGIRKIAIGW